MTKKPNERPQPEKPTTIPLEEPIEPSWPAKEPEIKPSIEPVPSASPKEIPNWPGSGHQIWGQTRTKKSLPIQKLS